MLSESGAIATITTLCLGVIGMVGMIIKLLGRIGKLENNKASKKDVDEKIKAATQPVLEQITQINYRMDEKDKVDNEHKREVADNMGYIRAKLEAG